VLPSSTRRVHTVEEDAASCGGAGGERGYGKVALDKRASSPPIVQRRLRRSVMDLGVAQGRSIGGESHGFGVVQEGEQIERRGRSKEGERG
jgi:hypothetical protein